MNISISDKGEGLRVAVETMTKVDDASLQGKRFAVLHVGDELDFLIIAFDREAAERCLEFAAAFSAAALELMRPVPAEIPPAKAVPDDDIPF